MGEGKMGKEGRKKGVAQINRTRPLRLNTIPDSYCSSSNRRGSLISLSAVARGGTPANNTSV